MKKFFSLSMAVIMLLAFAACGSKSVSGSSIPVNDESSEAVSESGLARDPLTGLYTLDPSAVGKRSLGLMINNIKISLPQRGIAQADLYYEVLAEGGITRILAIFPDVSKIPDTGSVRSARHYFFELASSHNAIFAHFGGSKYALTQIKEMGVKTINFMTANASYRDKTRVGKIPFEHTAFTDGTRLAKAITRLNIKTDGTVKDAFKFGDNSKTLDSGTAASSITVPFSSYDTSEFKYNSTTKQYEKWQFGKEHVDSSTGKPLSVTNVFVLRTSIALMDKNNKKNYINVDLSSGNGYYACGGKIIPITWKKNGFDNQLKYYTSDGKELTVSTGKTYVCIIPIERDITNK